MVRKSIKASCGTMKSWLFFHVWPSFIRECVCVCLPPSTRLSPDSTFHWLQQNCQIWKEKENDFVLGCERGRLQIFIYVVGSFRQLTLTWSYPPRKRLLFFNFWSLVINKNLPLTKWWTMMLLPLLSTTVPVSRNDKEIPQRNTVVPRDYTVTC